MNLFLDINLTVSENCGFWISGTSWESRHETLHNVWHSKLHVSVSTVIFCSTLIAVCTLSGQLHSQNKMFSVF